MPVNSPHGENGNGGFFWYLPAMISVSKKFSPTAATFAMTSPGAGVGSAMSASTRSSGGAEAGAQDGFHDGSRISWGEAVPPIFVGSACRGNRPPSHCRIPQYSCCLRGLRGYG